jgi:hypothetical protein
MDVNEWTSYECMVKKNPLSTFIINPLIDIRENKEKIALKIVVKVVSIHLKNILIHPWVCINIFGSRAIQPDTPQGPN